MRLQKKTIVKHLKLLVIPSFLICIFAIGCSSSGENSDLTDFEFFTLELPSDWEVLDYPVEEIGGLMSNGEDSLFYDYGVWAFDNLVDLNLHVIDTIEHQTLKIDNEDALILIGQREEENRITYNYLIDKQDGTNRIRYISYDAIDENAIRDIVLTHVFK